MVISSDVAGTGGRVMRAAFRRTVAWRWLVERRMVGQAAWRKPTSRRQWSQVSMTGIGAQVM
jgi:hypothetical protein